MIYVHLHMSHTSSGLLTVTTEAETPVPEEEQLTQTDIVMARETDGVVAEDAEDDPVYKVHYFYRHVQVPFRASR